MSGNETWFEVCVPWPLAHLLNDLTKAWLHSGSARRDEIEDRVREVITRPRGGQGEST